MGQRRHASTAYRDLDFAAHARCSADADY